MPVTCRCRNRGLRGLLEWWDCAGTTDNALDLLGSLETMDTMQENGGTAKLPPAKDIFHGKCDQVSLPQPGIYQSAAKLHQLCLSAGSGKGLLGHRRRLNEVPYSQTTNCSPQDIHGMDITARTASSTHLRFAKHFWVRDEKRFRFGSDSFFPPRSRIRPLHL